MAEFKTIARPYAKAVFESALEHNNLEIWSDVLADLSSVIKDKSATALLRSPKLSSKDKIEFLKSFVNHDVPQIEHFISLLVSNNRVILLPNIYELYESFKKAHMQAASIKLISAKSLGDEYIEKFREALSKAIGKTVSLISDVDASLIGGAKVVIGDTVIDGSVKGKLFRLANSLRK